MYNIPNHSLFSVVFLLAATSLSPNAFSWAETLTTPAAFTSSTLVPSSTPSPPPSSLGKGGQIALAIAISIPAFLVAVLMLGYTVYRGRRERLDRHGHDEEAPILHDLWVGWHTYRSIHVCCNCSPIAIGASGSNRHQEPPRGSATTGFELQQMIRSEPLQIPNLRDTILQPPTRTLMASQRFDGDVRGFIEHDERNVPG
ncbi:hypothetical protein EV356DRAFT_580030 [Viridothelium virens]|uniref:Mid2 domain-containing protein n=1 Tax=Viridothelium virens TaxID=1048519 RepID=A0A6A6GXM3_VIRVR|nr:hypothetical protein EV356DRAFT_580030 [Viridothelium virens]